MTHLLAWIGEQPGDLDRTLLQRSAAFTISGSSAPVGSDSWGLIADASVQLCHDARSACAVIGTVRTRDATLRQAMQSQGAPSAVLQAWREQGRGLAGKLDGAFSIVLIDADGARAVAISDKFGIEPLFFHQAGRRAVISDTMPGLLSHPWPGREIDPQALYDYLFFAMVPSPATGYRDVFRLPPASILEIKGVESTLQRYWKMGYEREHGRIDYNAEAVEFRRLLERAVASELDTNERVGCFLSGGTDSSTVAGLLTKVMGSPARSYSIGFDEPGFDEMSYARCAAKRFGTVHREYYVTPQDIVEMLERIPAQYAVPFGNSSAVPAYYCARMAHEDGITKLLGGDGGDELFGGNDFYRAQIVFSRYEYLPRWFRAGALEPVVGLVSGKGRVPLVRKAWRYIEQANMPMPDRLESYNFVHTMGPDHMLEPGFLAAVGREHPFELMREEYDGAAATTMLNRIMNLDMKLTLADNDLRKVGEMARLAGIKVGYPMLHEELAEFAARLPVSEKVRGVKLRYFFKRALADFLPQEIINKRKHGFGLPFGQWMRRDAKLQARVRESLDDFKRRGVARAEFVDELAGRRFGEHAGHYGKLIWLFVMMEQWLKQAVGNARVSG